MKNVRLEFGVVKDALFVALDGYLESGIEEFLGRGWGQRRAPFEFFLFASEPELLDHFLFAMDVVVLAGAIQLMICQSDSIKWLMSSKFVITGVVNVSGNFESSTPRPYPQPRSPLGRLAFLASFFNVFLRNE